MKNISGYHWMFVTIIIGGVLITPRWTETLVLVTVNRTNDSPSFFSVTVPPSNEGFINQLFDARVVSLEILKDQ